MINLMRETEGNVLTVTTGIVRPLAQCNGMGVYSDTISASLQSLNLRNFQRSIASSAICISHIYHKRILLIELRVPITNVFILISDDSDVTSII